MTMYYRPCSLALFQPLTLPTRQPEESSEGWQSALRGGGQSRGSFQAKVATGAVLDGLGALLKRARRALHGHWGGQTFLREGAALRCAITAQNVIVKIAFKSGGTADWW